MLGKDILSAPINDFHSTLPNLAIGDKCEAVYRKMVDVLDTKYPGKFLAVLFKNPTMSKDVFEQSTAP